MTPLRVATLVAAASLCGLAWLLWPGPSNVRSVQSPVAEFPADSALDFIAAAASHDGRARESVVAGSTTDTPTLKLSARVVGGEEDVAASFSVEDPTAATASRELGKSKEAMPLYVPADFAALPAGIHAHAEIGGHLFRGRASLEEIPANGECVVELGPTLSIAGTVVYPDGTPVGAGFVVIGSSMRGPVATAPERLDPLGHFARATTDERGEFLLTGFARDTDECLMQSLGPGWGTSSFPTQAVVVSAGAIDVQLVVRPLFATLVREGPQVGDGSIRSLVGRTELSVDSTQALVVFNYLVLGGSPESGWVLHVYTAATDAESIPATLHCRGLDPASTRTTEVEIPRWRGGSLARLQDESCGIAQDLVHLEVVIVGGLGWDQLHPNEEVGDFVLGSSPGSGVGAALTAGDLSKGSARFFVPRGRYQYALRLSSLSRPTGDRSGPVDALSDDNVLLVDLTDTGALLLNARWADGTPFVGGVSASFNRIFHDEEVTLPNGMPGRNLQGFGSQQRWSGPPYLAPALVPGNYAVTLHSSTLQYRAFRPAGPIQLVTVESGKLSMHELRYVPAAD